MKISIDARKILIKDVKQEGRPLRLPEVPVFTARRIEGYTAGKRWENPLVFSPTLQTLST